MKYFILLFAFIFFGQVYCQEKSLLYQIKKDGYKTSYIFGTVHIIPDSLFFFPPKLTKTIKKSELVVLEIGNTGNQAELVKLMHLESGSSFEIFTPEQKDSVLAWGSELLHVKKEQFEALYSSQKPFALLQLDVLKMVGGSYKMYEQEIQAIASNASIPIKGFETMAYQIGLFDQLPDSVIASMVMTQIRNPQLSEEETRKLYLNYVNQDIESLFFATQQSEPATLETLVFQRNRNWIPLVTAFMKTQTCFFAVGAAHLGGNQGVLELLKQAGFEITPIKL